MILFKRYLKYSILVGLIGLVAWMFLSNWSFVFKKRIVGEIQAVERVSVSAIVTPQQVPLNPQLFSFSVAIKDIQTNEIHMASSEDRQWAAAQKGNCVVAVFFPYPPWRLSKGMTGHNARLLRNFTSCQEIPQEFSFWDNIKFFFMVD